MSFDGQRYDGPSFIAAAAYHPGAVAVPDVAAGALHNAYFDAVHCGRVLCWQTRAFNRLYNSAFPGRTRIYNLTLQRIAEVDGYLASNVERVKALVAFRGYTQTDGQVRIGLRVDDGSTVASSTEISAFTANISANASGPFLRQQVSEQLGILTAPADIAVVEADVSGLTLDQVVNVQVTAGIQNTEIEIETTGVVASGGTAAATVADSTGIQVGHTIRTVGLERVAGTAIDTENAVVSAVTATSISYPTSAATGTYADGVGVIKRQVAAVLEPYLTVIFWEIQA